MKKGIILILTVILSLFLAGCAKEAPMVWETVNDSIPVQSTEPLSDYRITFAVPEDAVLQTAGVEQGPMLYAGKNGDYEIMTQRLESDSIQTVAKEISGFRFDELSPMRWEEFDMERYDFVWSSAEDGGQMVHRAAVLEDNGAYYVLTFSVQEDAVGDCQEKIQSVFSTLGLNEEEGF